MVIEVLPSVLAEVISVTPAMWPNCRSSGVATEDAMIWALPPGKPALTEIVGKSTSGSGETGSTSNATAPASAIATVSSVVATGRWMNGAEMFMPALVLPVRLRFPAHAPGRLVLRRTRRKTLRQFVEENVDHWRGV